MVYDDKIIPELEKLSMRKIAISAGVLIIIAFFLGIPYFFGQTNQSLSNELLARANQMLQSKSEPLAPEEQIVVASFIIDEKIYHGPFYWGKDANGKTHFGFGRGYFVSTANPDPQTRQWLNEQGLNTLAPNWETRSAEISLLGRIRTTSHLSALTYKNSNTLLSWQGANSKMMLSPGLSNLKASVNIGDLTYKQDQMLLQIPNANVNAKLRYKNGLWVGSSELQIPQITSRWDDKVKLSLSNLLLQGKSNVSGNLLGSTITFGADTLELGTRNYGPFSYNVDIKNIDANAWLKLRELAAQYDALMNADALQYALRTTQYQRGWFTSNAQIVLTVSRAKPTGLIKRQLHNLTRKSELLLVGNEISKTLPTIINKGAQFSLAPTPGHTEPQMFQLNASLVFPKVLQAKGIGELIEKAESHVKITFLADLVKIMTAHQYPDKNRTDIDNTASNLINKWVASGYLKQNANQYVFSLDYSQGKLSINDKVIADAAQTVSNDVSPSIATAPTAAAAAAVIPAAR